MKRIAEREETKEKCGERAFTLVELMVAMSLLAIVAVAVISFLVYLSAYSRTREAQSKELEELALLRAETDYWFSFFDADGVDLTFAGEGANATDFLVRAESEGKVYRIFMQDDAQGSGLVFTYPSSIGRGEDAGEYASVRLDVTAFERVCYEAYGAVGGAETRTRSEQESLGASGAALVFDGKGALQTFDGAWRFTVRQRVAGRRIACTIFCREGADAG